MDESSAASAAQQFQTGGAPVSVAPYGSGHINDTFCAAFASAAGATRFILQRINGVIFPNTAALMSNIERVTAHIAGKLEFAAYKDRRVLTLIPTHDGSVWHRDEHGRAWRMYRFIDDAHAFDTITSEQQAYRAARSFAEFQRMLADLPTPRLNDTIPDFHNTPKRFAAFEKALRADAFQRARTAEHEIEFALSRKPMAGALLSAGLPERVTHNDTKINNILFDDATGESLCVLDLDTVMPGLSLYDFGDMVRTATSSADEDERDLSKVGMHFNMFEALLRGYLDGARDFLTRDEKRLLAAAGAVITYEQGLRFLTDYLAGDSYYKIHREGHNLDRTRAQFRLLESIEGQRDAMERLIAELARG